MKYKTKITTLTFLSPLMNRAVVEWRPPDLFLPFLECLVKVSWSKSGNTPDFIDDEELLVAESKAEDNDADIISVVALSSILTDWTFNEGLFVFCLEVTFCGVTVNSTFRKRVSNISLVFSMY